MAACTVTSEAETRTKTLADASSLSNHLGIHAPASMYILSMTCPSFHDFSDLFRSHLPNEYFGNRARECARKATA